MSPLAGLNPTYMADRNYNLVYRNLYYLIERNLWPNVIDTQNKVRVSGE